MINGRLNRLSATPFPKGPDDDEAECNGQNGEQKKPRNQSTRSPNSFIKSLCLTVSMARNYLHKNRHDKKWLKEQGCMMRRHCCCSKGDGQRKVMYSTISQIACQARCAKQRENCRKQCG